MELGREEFTERQEKLFKTSVFFGKFLALGLVFQLILLLKPDTAVFQSGLASITAELLKLLGQDYVARGIFVYSPEAIYRITQDCLGWKSMAAFTGLMLSSHKIRELNLRFLFYGLVGITLANIVRIVTTVMMADRGLISFDIIHGVLWKWGLTGLILITWTVYLLKNRGLSLRNL